MIHGNHIINKIAEDIQNNHIEKLSLYDLRFQDYIQSLKIQEKVHAFVQKENISGVVLTMNYPNLYTIGKSGNKSDILVPQEDLNKSHPSNQNLPNSFVPGRNLLFLSIASSIAYNRKIENIVIGVCETDFSGYPDCRDEFIKSMKKTIHLATEKSIEIHTPLMNLDKAQTWKLAKDLGCIDTIIKSTMTDYNGSKNENDWGLGNLDNPASILRHKGYLKAKKNKWI